MKSWSHVQWKDVLTIKNGRSQKGVVNESGRYPIYGSGGVMGYADDYLCDAGTTVIGRKGSINSPLYVQEKFWNVDTAFGLCVGENLDSKFFYYFCLTYNFLKHNKATTLPSLTKADLLKIKIPLPPLAEQKKIAAILDAADQLRQKDQQLIDHYTTLSQSLFLEMFGDPMSNPMGWDVRPLKSMGTVSTGNTPSRSNYENYGNDIEWIKTNNVNTPDMYLTKAEEYLSEAGLRVGRTVEPGSLLVTCIAGSKKVIGNVAIADRKVAFNQQINSFTPRDGNIYFFYYVFIVAKEYIQSFSTNGMKGMINKSKFQSMEFIFPPKEEQHRFGNATREIEQQKKLAQMNFGKSDELFNSLLQKAFKGELTSSKAA
ncbi:hypothetical protein AB833_03735 [Chromatiales bacterium (ex Bugula neritina AB1)]|nr:hypothetical protein AB833_03735 [Chromatiales bacterium (ex Bugula neritina AB1)]